MLRLTLSTSAASSIVNSSFSIPVPSGGLITSCRTVARRVPNRQLGGGVFGFPSLSLSDGLQEQDGSGWNVGVGGCGAFPLVRPVLRAVGWLDTGCFEQLPNKFAPLGAVIGEALVGPLSGDQHPAPGDAEVLGAVRFALAASRRHRVPGPVGLNAIEQPDRTPRRARRDLQLGLQPASVIALGIGGLFTESGGLSDALGQIFGEIADVPARFLSTPENAFDVHLFPEAHHVGRFGQSLAGLFPTRQRHPGGRVGESPCPGVPYREPIVGVADWSWAGHHTW